MEPDELHRSSFSMTQVDVLIDTPGVTEAETLEKCRSVLELKPGSVWVKPCYVQAAISCLRHADISIGTTLGCEDGANATQIKVAEAKRALTEGATRLAVRVNLGYAREGHPEKLIKDLHAVSGIAHMNGVRIEAAFAPLFLDAQQVIALAHAAEQADIDMLSFPIDLTAKDWGFSMMDSLLERPIPLKGVLNQTDRSDLVALFDMGLACVGVHDFKAAQ